MSLTYLHHHNDVYSTKQKAKGTTTEKMKLFVCILQSFIDSIFLVFRGNICLANNRILHGYKPCSSPCWAIPLLLWRRVHRKPKLEVVCFVIESGKMLAIDFKFQVNFKKWWGSRLCSNFLLSQPLWRYIYGIQLAKVTILNLPHFDSDIPIPPS
jgi:hypothetical protein